MTPSPASTPIGDRASERAGQSVSVEKLIAAPAETIFALVCDPAMHPLIDGSGTVREPVASQSRLALGSTFGMKMRMGLAYRVKNRVVEYETDRLIAWQTNFGQTWRYELTPVVVPAAQTSDAQLPDAQSPEVRLSDTPLPAASALAAHTLVRETFDWSTAKWPRGIELARFHRRNVAGMAASLERLAILATERV